MGLSHVTDTGVSRGRRSAAPTEDKTHVPAPATPGRTHDAACTCAPHDTRTGGRSGSARSGHKAEPARRSATISDKPWCVRGVACPASIKSASVNTPMT